MNWKQNLINFIDKELNKSGLNGPSLGIHLAVFKEPFLSLVLSGKKKVESRFSIKKSSPYEKIKKGDVVILKESGGLVVGFFISGKVKFFNNLNTNTMKEIENTYSELACFGFDKNFWKTKSKTKYTSLI